MRVHGVCHRDYGAPYDIQVKIFEDSLCISSPGQLPFDMPMDFLMKPTHPSRPRNKLIAQAFFDMGIIERYGSGIKRIKKECDKNGNSYPEWSDQYGEFATTYRPRVTNGARSVGVLQEVTQTVMAQSAMDALRNALKELRKNASDDVVEKIVLVYGKITENHNVTLSAIAAELNLSERAVDEYIVVLKCAGALRRKDGKRFGAWEVLM